MDTKTLIACVKERKRLDEMGFKFYAPNIAYDYCDIIKALETLKKYEDMEEQGRMLKLPCKSGDTVYMITLNDVIDKLVIEEMTVLEKVDGSVTAKLKCSKAGLKPRLYAFLDDFGKNLFLTESEAQNALKERIRRGGWR